MALFGSLGEVNVGALSATTTDNAVDVFVYDTRKDSDGGQWRKRTQHTSWYNETLNTATRGSRRDFPAVAVLVLETGKLTIYDGDDPDMPMWMIFNTTDGSMLRSGVMTSIVMMNGEFWVGHDSGSGLHWVNFLKDTARWITASSSYGGFFKKTSIIFRNDAGANYDNNIGGASDVFIAGSSVKDLAMTVLPNAPIDSATGLPVPTVAVATESGVSVIKDDGTVESTDVANIVEVGFIKGDRLAYGHRAGFAYQGLALNVSPFRNASTYGWYINSEVPSLGGSIASDSPGVVLGVGDGNVYFYGGATGGIRRVFENEQSKVNGMTNFITTSYNTGWMHGDIKGAWLSDTSTASVTGTELVTNGTFAGNLNGWTLAGDTTPTYDSASGGAKITTGTSVDGQINQTITSTTGVVVTFSITARTSGFVGLALNGTLVLDGLTELQSYTYYSDSTITSVGLVHRGGGGGYAIVDNVSVRKTEKDRSVNNKGLQVYGTITKTPVATGSNLVAYSGFSPNTNELRQPFNSALDFGTNNFSVSFWHFHTSGQPDISIVRAPSSGVGWGLYIGNAAQEVYTVQLTNGGWTAFATNTGSNGSLNSTWQKWDFIRQFGVGWLIYRNGVYISTHNVSTGTNFTSNANAELIITGSQPTTDRISLLRISASTPSPEQIKKIYEDEKALFQPNSQCTLYGSSDAVTALAYDDTYQILSVGTSSGRSDFRGLERINNTTTAVTTAISASNGLIAEQ